MPGKRWSFEEAVRRMREGKIGVYPTETFMALGCRAGSGEAVERVYAAKCRARGLPLPVLACDAKQVESVARILPEAEALMERFWPGPLSILLPALPHVPPAVSAGTGFLGIRVTGHPGARALASAVGEPLVGSSANISGGAPAPDAARVDLLLLERVDGLWDEAPKPRGLLPSTLLRVEAARRVRILRPGAIAERELLEAGFTVAGAF
jgi:L-threonylcarbamoyladenylate synthase